jgi:hypothetical protein
VVHGDKNYREEARTPMDKMLDFETRLASFSVTIEEFIEDVGKLPLQDEAQRVHDLQSLAIAARAVKMVAPWSMVEEALRLDGGHTLTNDHRKRFRVAHAKLDKLRVQFEGACRTLEESRKLWLGGMN